MFTPLNAQQRLLGEGFPPLFQTVSAGSPGSENVSTSEAQLPIHLPKSDYPAQPLFDLLLWRVQHKVQPKRALELAKSALGGNRATPIRRARERLEAISKAKDVPPSEEVRVVVRNVG